MVAHGLEHLAIRHLIGRYPKVYRYCKAVSELCLLNVSVGRKKTMVGHLGIANLARYRANIFIASRKALLILLPELTVKHKHRRRAIKNIEKIALIPQCRQLIVVVAPVPLSYDTIVIDQLPERQAIFMLGEQYYNKAFGCENHGQTAEAKSHFQKAIAIWERIIKQFPEARFTTAQAYDFSATCYQRLGEYEKAIEYYQQLLDKWPDYEYAWNAQFLIGCILERLKKDGLIPDSVADPVIKDSYERVLEQYPDCRAVKAATTRLSHHLKRRTE